jgi:transposase-like protein
MTGQVTLWTGNDATTQTQKVRREYGSDENNQIVPERLGGEENIAELCRREGISPSL